MCDCCCGDGRRYAHVLTASSSRATYVEAEEVISQRFLRSPPAVLECTHGEARGQRLWLDACGWEAQKWQLDGRLQSVPHDERHAVRGMLLMCVNGSFVLQPLNAQSELWIHSGAPRHGAGGLRVRNGEVLRVAGHELRAELPAGSGETRSPARRSSGSCAARRRRCARARRSARR